MAEPTLAGGGCKVPQLDKVQRRIKEFLVEETKSEVIFEYIAANVATFDALFIRALTTAVVESALNPKTYRLNVPAFKRNLPLLNRYIENKEAHEVQCLFAIQILITRLEHPSGVLRTLLETLNDEDTISVEGFKIWRDSTEEPEGKGNIGENVFFFQRKLIQQII